MVQKCGYFFEPRFFYSPLYFAFIFSLFIFAVLAIKLLPLRKFHLVLVAMNFIGILPISATTTQNLDKLCT